MLHPFTNEIWTRHDAKLAAFPIHQIEQRMTIEFFECSQAQQRPQPAFSGRLHQMVEIAQMSFKQLSGDSNGDVWILSRGRTESAHVSPSGRQNLDDV